MSTASLQTPRQLLDAAYRDLGLITPTLYTPQVLLPMVLVMINGATKANGSCSGSASELSAYFSSKMTPLLYSRLYLVVLTNET